MKALTDAMAITAAVLWLTRPQSARLSEVGYHIFTIGSRLNGHRPSPTTIMANRVLKGVSRGVLREVLLRPLTAKEISEFKGIIGHSTRLGPQV